MNVLYTSTRGYYPFLKWSLTSLVEHNPDVMVYIFAEDDELPYEIPCRHKVINVSDKMFLTDTSPNRNSYFSAMSMMRVCAPNLLDVDKVIYIDVDTIICDSLEPIWNIDLSGKWVAWCQEYHGRHRPYGDLYFNFGIAVLNLVEMRKDHVAETLMDMLNTDFYQYNEQDAMNKIIPSDKFAFFSPRFNNSPCCGYTNDPAIVHYAGYRDWHSNRHMPKVEYLDKYRS